MPVAMQEISGYIETAELSSSPVLHQNSPLHKVFREVDRLPFLSGATEFHHCNIRNHLKYLMLDVFLLQFSCGQTQTG